VLKSQKGEEIKFKIKRTTKFSKVLNQYCEKVGAEPGTYWLMFDGDRVQPEDTADTLGLEEDFPVFDIKLEQTGGGIVQVQSMS